MTLPINNGIVTPGIYTGIPAEDYHAAPGISSSQLKYLSQKTPAHWKAKFVDGEIEDKRSDSMSLGTVAHALILEPETFDQQFKPALNPEDFPNALKGKDAIVKRLKEINEDIKEKADKLKISGTIAELSERLITVDSQAVLWDKLVAKAAEDPREAVALNMWEAAHRMRDNVFRNKTAAKLLTGGVAESSIFSVHPETGLPVRVRPDYMNVHERIMVDLKTTRDANPFKWGKDAGTLGYHLQQAMYLNVPTLLPDPVYFDDFVFVLVENTAPYICECAVLEKDTVSAGWDRYLDSLSLLTRCISTDHWPGYSEDGGIVTVEAPAWAA